MDGRYSLARYSAGAAGRDVQSSLRCIGRLNAVSGATVPVQAAARFASALRGSIQGTTAMIAGLPARGRLSASVRMSANVLAGMCRAGALQSAARAGKNTAGSGAALARLGGNMRASKTIPAALPARGMLSGQTAGGKNIPASLTGAGVLTTLPEATSQTTETARVLLRIPPGGELRLDSALFTALLNGENVLYAQQGARITLSNRLRRLIIESVSGGKLTGQLIFTERYL